MNLRAALAVLAGASCGCTSLHQPMNPTEYRAAFKSNAWSTETFEVARPHPQVSAILRRKARECLAVTVEKASYRPSITVTRERTELAVRRGGHYVFLADASPSSRTSTSVTLYPAGASGSEIGTALMGWVKGHNMGCPDLANVP